MTYLRTPCEHSEVTTPANPAARPENEKWVLVATILGSSMAFIDGTVVNVALPALQTALGASVSQIQWVIESYSLTLAALLLAGGALGDIYGRRFIFLIGVIIFALASIACGLSGSIMQLIIARGIQGVGAALLVPGSLALITATIPEERRGQAIGTWAGFTSVTTAAGPVVGGWLVQHASWRWIFFLNLPLAIIVFLVSVFYVCESKNEDQSRVIDIPGIFLVTLGLGAVVFGLLEWHQGSFVIVISQVIGISALLLFLWVEAHSKTPMVPLSIFHSVNFCGANLLTFFLYFALFGVLFFFPLDLIQVQGYSATQAGAALLPFILLMFFLSRWSGGLVKQFGPKLPLVVGPAITAVGFSLFLTAGVEASYWRNFFPATVVLGLGMAVSVAPLTTVVMSSVALNHVGVASGINNAVSRIAGLLAIAILGLVMMLVFTHQLSYGLMNSAVPLATRQAIMDQHLQLAAIQTDNPLAQQIIHNAFVQGYHAVIWIAVVLALASALTAALYIAQNKQSQKATHP